MRALPTGIGIAAERRVRDDHRATFCHRRRVPRTGVGSTVPRALCSTIFLHILYAGGIWYRLNGRWNSEFVSSPGSETRSDILAFARAFFYKMLQTRELWVRPIEWLILNLGNCVMRRARCSISLSFMIPGMNSTHEVMVNTQFHKLLLNRSRVFYICTWKI